MKQHMTWMAVFVPLLFSATAQAGVEAAKGKNVAEPSETKPKGSGDPTTGLDRLGTARDLVAYGMENEDAYALVTAARMLAEVRPGKLEAKREQKAGKEKAKAKDTTGYPTDVPAILAKAEEFAQGDESVIAAVKSIRSRAGSKGPTAGPDSACYTIRPDYVDIFRTQMRGQERFEVGVVGNGASDLDLFVFDNNGNLIGVDSRYGVDKGYVSAVPIYTATFQIEVRNVGSRYNTYCIAIR